MNPVIKLSVQGLDISVSGQDWAVAKAIPDLIEKAIPDLVGRILAYARSAEPAAGEPPAPSAEPVKPNGHIAVSCYGADNNFAPPSNIIAVALPIGTNTNQIALETIAAAAAPAKKAAKKQAAKKHAAKPASSSGAAAGKYDAYPASLRDPRAEIQRRVYDGLIGGPKELAALVEACRKEGWSEANSSAVMNALMSLRAKNLVKKADQAFGGAWMVA